MARKRRRAQRAKFNTISRYNLEAIIVGVGELVLFIASVTGTFIEQNQIIKAFASLGTICIFVSFINMVISFRSIFAHEYNIIGRIAALLISTLTLLLWLGIYLIGITSVLK